MNIVEILSGPIIGAAIGFGTNYVAVKMLFRPLYPIKIGKHTLPFTPGVIPKRKDDLAQTLGAAVGNMLITKEDLEKVLLSDGMKQSVTEGIFEYIAQKSETTMLVKDTIISCMDETQYNEGKDKLEQLVCGKIISSLSNVDLGTIIANEASTSIKEKVKGTMLAMFVNDDLIASIAEPIGKKVKVYIENRGSELIEPIISDEIKSLENLSVTAILDKIPLNEIQIKELADRVYTDCIMSSSDAIIQQFDIAGIVKNKIIEMPVEDIEKLVLSVMKNELDTVVNLGAGLGFIIGFLNMLF